MSIRLIKTCISIFLFLLLFAGCQTLEKQRTGILTIVTTTGMIQDALQEIAGEHADVIALMGPGVDPHLYKATQGDLKKLSNADIIFYNGLHLEGKLGEVLEKLARTKPVIPVADHLPDSLLRQVEGFQGAYDPHIWFDVSRWKLAVEGAGRFLQDYDSLHALTYAANLKRYLARLDSLHAAVLREIETIPEQQRVLITAHDAFGYFGDAYRMEVRGLQGISTVSEFGLRDVTNLVDFIIERKIKAIFVETSVSEKSINAVIEGCRQKNWNVSIGGSLYSDAMGEAGTPEGTYIGMVHANVKTITEALK